MINLFDIDDEAHELNKKIEDLTMVIYLLINQCNQNQILSEALIKEILYKSIKKLYLEVGITEEKANSVCLIQNINTGDFPTLTSYISLMKSEIDSTDDNKKVYYQYIFNKLKTLKDNGFLDIFDGKTDLIVTY